MSAHDGAKDEHSDNLFDGTNKRSGADRRQGDRRTLSLDFDGPERRRRERRSGVDRRQRRASRRRRV